MASELLGIEFKELDLFGKKMHVFPAKEYLRHMYFVMEVLCHESKSIAFNSPKHIGVWDKAIQLGLMVGVFHLGSKRKNSNNFWTCLMLCLDKNYYVVNIDVRQCQNCHTDYTGLNVRVPHSYMGLPDEAYQWGMSLPYINVSSG